MTVKKEGWPALVCCLVLLSTCVQATEELEMAWMKGASLQDATIAAVVGDASVSVFVTGDTSSDFGRGSPNLGQRDAYLIKYNPNGDVMWVYPLGTKDVDSASCLTVDAEGYCFMGGQTSGSLAPNLNVETGDTQQDAFVAKISPKGTCVWIRQFGSAMPDSICRIRLNRDGNCYVAGTTCCKVRNVSRDGRKDGGDDTIEECASECPFVAKFDTNGRLVWFNQVRESYANTGLGVGADSNGTVALVGQPGYVATFDANGVLLESCPLAHRFESIMDACVDDLGHVYLVGRQSGWWSTVIQYNLKGQEGWSRRFQENGWSNTKSIVLCLDGSHDMVTVGCQGEPSGKRSCQTFLRRYSQSGGLVSIFSSPEGYCGAKAGADSLRGAYAISRLQSDHAISYMFKLQSASTIAPRNTWKQKVQISREFQ